MPSSLLIMHFGPARPVMEEEVAAVVNILLDVFEGLASSLVVVEFSFRCQSLKFLAVVGEKGGVLAEGLGFAADGQCFQLLAVGRDRLDRLLDEFPVPTSES